MRRRGPPIGTPASSSKWEKRKNTNNFDLSKQHGKKEFRRKRNVEENKEEEEEEEVEIDEKNTPFNQLVTSLLSNREKTERELRVLEKVEEEFREGLEDDDSEQEEEIEREDEAEANDDENSAEDDLSVSEIEDNSELEAEEETGDDKEAKDTEGIESDDIGNKEDSEDMESDDDNHRQENNDDTSNDGSSENEEDNIDEKATEEDDVPENDPFKLRLNLSSDSVTKAEVSRTISLDKAGAVSDQTQSKDLTVKAFIPDRVQILPAQKLKNLKPRLEQSWIKYRKLKTEKSQEPLKESLNLTELQKYLAPLIMDEYLDLSFCDRTLHNAVELREIYTLHVANHIFKARDAVERHDSRISQRRRESRSTGKPARFTDKEEDEFRDQGFTRARVLVILPYKSSAFRFVKLLLELFPEKTRVKNWDRFIEEFSPPLDEDDEIDQPENAWKIHEQKCRKSSECWSETDYALNRHPSMLVPDSSSESGERLNTDAKQKKKKRKKLMRPADWHATFEENHEEDFRFGISLRSKRSVKLYSGFYQSDIIIASPLGLRLATKQAMETSKFKEDEQDMINGLDNHNEEDEDAAFSSKNKSRKKPKIEEEEDTDFLSSIELLIIDEADVYHTQNWQHVEDVVVGLNRRPKKLREEIDFSRVYQHFLDTSSRTFRQTLIFSSFPDAPLNALIKRGGFESLGLFLNVSGSVRLRPKSYVGTSSFAPPQLVQRFRLTEDSVDERFEFFREKIIPKLVNTDRTLLFVPSYLDFARIRKAFKALQDKKDEEEGLRGKRKKSLFECCTEYSSPSLVAKARSKFFHGDTKVLIVTERFHYYFRFKIRGVLRVVFYAPPQHAAFYLEILDLIQSHNEGEAVTFFSDIDSLELERIIGTKRAKKTLASGQPELTIVCEADEE
jgi:U3 small nucleolar RNA-associated protein 25